MRHRNIGRGVHPVIPAITRTTWHISPTIPGKGFGRGRGGPGGPGDPGGGNFGQTDQEDFGGNGSLGKAVQLLIEMKKEEMEARRKKDMAGTDVRLKVEQKLTRIYATSAEKFPDEIDNFEIQMRRNQVKTWQLWY